jgi:lipopolysaccharide transport system permease protein
MVIFTFIRGVLKIPSEGVPYVIFSYSALVPWTFFSNAVTRCGPSVYNNGAILKKVAITREVFPFAGVVTSLADFFISSIILIGMMIWFKVPVGWLLLWVPLLVVITFFLALGVGLGVAAVGTYKHDIIFATPFLMQFWLLTTPIMYPLSQVPERWRFVYSLNPMVGIIEGFRSVMVKGIAPDPELLVVSLVGIALVWFIAWPLFRYVSQYFADVL